MRNRGVRRSKGEKQRRRRKGAKQTTAREKVAKQDMEKGRKTET